MLLKYCRNSPPINPQIHQNYFSKRQKSMLNNNNIMAYTQTNEPDLWTVPITLDKSAGHEKPMEINSIYQDTRPTKASRGTVVAIHGSPGSHKDFKYVTPLLREKGIRTIAINWPGMGYSEYNNRMRNDNQERDQFVQAIVNSLGLKRPLIFLGHSRGCENAFRVATQNDDKTVAVVAANFVGFRVHKGVRPFWVIKLLSAIWEYSWWLALQPVLSPLLKIVYDFVGLKVSSGFIAGRCLATMVHTDFDAQLPFLRRIWANPRIRFLAAYAGNDFLVETEKSHEFVNAIPDCNHLVSETDYEEDRIITDTQNAIKSGNKHIAVFFPKEGHFLQKQRCSFLANSIVELFDAAKMEVAKNKNKEPTQQFDAQQHHGHCTTHKCRDFDS